MRILFLHPNMPGQYKHLARVFGEDKNNEVVFITKPKPGVEIAGVHKIEYTVSRDVTPETHRYLIPFERAVYASQEIWRICKKLKESGFIPDVIVGHLGWGNGMFLKDIYPDAPILSFFEFYYNSTGGDVNFFPDDETTEDDKARIRMKNALHLYNLTDSDWGICPTFFQLQQNPRIFHPRISVIHDGIDTDVVKPGTGNNLILPNGVKLSPQDEVITYISRNFEPYRGFPTFMRAAEIIMKNRPNCHIVMVGQDGVSYGKKPPAPFKSYREMMMKEVNLDMSRFHYLGYLPYDQMIKVMQISAAHIYLTVPFVLSWSLLEAMACGCVIIGSNTPPLQEVIEDGVNGLLVDFFSHEEVAGAVEKILSHPDRMQEVRKAARKTVVDKYALKDLLPMHIALVRELAEGKNPPPTGEKIRKRNQKLFKNNPVASDLLL